MPQSQRAETILLVDNDPIIRRLISRTLDEQHYASLEASNAEDALVISAQYAGSIDLLLTEVSMPGIGGFRLVDHLTSMRPTMKVLYMSGHYLGSPGVRRGLHHSQRRFLLKPFTRDQLVSTIREVLEASTDQHRDAFDLILANPKVAAEPTPDSPPPHRVPRALRFRARMAMRYRTALGLEWHDGVTENISRSGVLFQSVRVLPLETPVEMFLTLPGGMADEPTRRLCCHGEIVRGPHRWPPNRGPGWRPPSMGMPSRPAEPVFGQFIDPVHLLGPQRHHRKPSARRACIRNACSRPTFL